MKNQTFVYSLTPFEDTTDTNLISVSAELFLESTSKFKIDYEISGDLPSIAWPLELKGAPRMDDLWNHTCLEAFFSVHGKEGSKYEEINCSPSGAWNAYEFSSYRLGMASAKDITVRLENAQRESTSAQFQVDINTGFPCKVDSFALAAVIEFTNGNKSYWAIKHPPGKPDFHNRSFWINF